MESLRSLFPFPLDIAPFLFAFPSLSFLLMSVCLTQAHCCPPVSWELHSLLHLPVTSMRIILETISLPDPDLIFQFQGACFTFPTAWFGSSLISARHKLKVWFPPGFLFLLPPACSDSLAQGLGASGFPHSPWLPTSQPVRQPCTRGQSILRSLFLSPPPSRLTGPASAGPWSSLSLLQDPWTHKHQFMFPLTASVLCSSEEAPQILNGSPR